MIILDGTSRVAFNRRKVRALVSLQASMSDAMRPQQRTTSPSHHCRERPKAAAHTPYRCCIAAFALRPFVHIAANGGSPPIMSKCAWCSIGHKRPNCAPSWTAQRTEAPALLGGLSAFERGLWGYVTFHH